MHVWVADLDLDDQVVKRHLEKLSAQEKDRAARFHFFRDRNRFVVRRGMLRSLLADYIQLKAADLVFVTNPFGKPALAPEFSPSVQFNLSHSGNLAVFGFALDRALGIDIEKIRHDLDCWDLAQRNFANDEIAALAQLSGDARTQAFFCVWTRKEAYIKALGMGVSFPLDRFAVTAGSDCPALLWSDKQSDKQWLFHQIDVGGGAVSVVAVDGEVKGVRSFSFCD